VPYKAFEKNELHDLSSCFEATALPATLRYRVFCPAPRKGIFQQSGLMGGEAR